jgi:hypothetical protein
MLTSESGTGDPLDSHVPTSARRFARRSSLVHPRQGKIPAIKRALAGFAAWALLGAAASASAGLVHRWSFNGTANDSVGSANGTLYGTATISDGKLSLSGSSENNRMEATLGNALGPNKTLVAWCSLSSLTPNNTAGSPLSVGNASFDAIVYGERTGGQWMNGSENWSRTPANNGGALETLVAPNEIMMAITYDSSATNKIKLYRNGVLYAQHNQGAGVSHAAGEKVLIGPRAQSQYNDGYMNGYINEARIYDYALTDVEIQGLNTLGPDTLPGVSFDITASAGTGGAISPAGVGAVAESTTPTYTITPAIGYDVADVVLDAGTGSESHLGAVTTYTFAPVTAAHTITASFVAVPPATGSLRNKTLVAWVRLDDLLQTGSGVLAIQDGNEFDAITFGERAAARWMAGSHNFSRTQSTAEQQLLAPETATPDQWLQLAVVYRDKQIEIRRNGQLYTAYEAANQQTYADRCDLYLGMRCLFSNQAYGFLKGAINEARIYDSALDAAAIAQLTPGTLNGPAPLGCWTFDGGSVKDAMGHYPDAQLIGTATVKDGALVLDGQGYALISQRLIADYRPPTVHAGFYTPPHRVGLMWDTWIYWHAGIYYMYYIAGPFGRWDAHEIAVSRDGVYWHYQGVAVTPRPQTAWIGTGHVWKSSAFASDGQWILNYSEWFGNKQDIMFATSPDLLHWTKVDESLRFVQDTRWYQAAGRWDCIDAIQGDDGWLYGYFTADPDPAKVSYAHCGFGFARSSDGLHWEALPPVPGNMTGEFGGIQKIGGKYYITVSEGRVGVATSPMGPFMGQPKNSNVFGGDIYFPRFFHTAPDGPLMNHFYTGGPIYAAPLKAINIDSEGILRLVWWPGNDKLKAARLPVTLHAPQGAIQWLDTSFDVNQTLVIEGTANLPATGPAAGELIGLLLEQGNNTAQCVSLERTLTRFGEVSLNAQPLALSVRQTANRDLDLGTRQHFRILLNRDMMEVYVNDYLTILARVRNTGRFGLLTGTAPDGIENLQVWRSGGLDTWASGFPGLTDKSPAGDPDHDGLSNLMEYVIGGDPRLASSSHLPAAACVGTDLVLSYQRRDESQTDTTALGQWSTDLLNWNNIPPVMVSENAADPDSMEIRIPLTNAVGGQLFGRLQVTKPPPLPPDP